MTVLGVFAGGHGKRLMPLTMDTPKVLIEFLPGNNTLDRIIGSARRCGITDVHLLIGSHYEMVMKRYGKNKDGSIFNYHVENVPMGTLHAFRSVCDATEGDLLLMNGDVVTDIDLGTFIAHARRSPYLIDMVVKKMRSPYGIVNVKDDMIVSFEEKPLLPVLMNAGIYYLKGDFRKYASYEYDGKNIEETVFPTLSSDGKMGAYLYDGFHHSLDGFKDLEEIRKHLDPGKK